MQTQLARFGGLAGLGLMGLSFALNGSVPGNNSSGAEAAAWFDSHTTRHVLSAWTGGVAVLALFAFFFAVGIRMQNHGERNLVNASSSLSLVVVTLLFLGNVPIMAGAMTSNDRRLALPPATAEVFLHFGIGFYLMMVIALSGYLFVTGTAMIRAVSLPNLLGYLSLAGGAVALLPIFGFLGFVAVLPLWIIATTAWLLRAERPHPTAASREASAPALARGLRHRS